MKGRNMKTRHDPSPGRMQASSDVQRDMRNELATQLKEETLRADHAEEALRRRRRVTQRNQRKAIRVPDQTKGQHPDGKCWRRAPLPPKGNGMSLCGFKWKHKGPHAWDKTRQKETK